MSKSAIDELGELLTRYVRDAAIQSCDMQLRPDVQSPVARRWRAAAATAGGNLPPDVVIPDCVDETISALLQAIDQGLLRLSFTTSNGETVDLSEEGLGELSGWYMGSGGWRAMYSKERFVDDFEDLASQ